MSRSRWLQLLRLISNTRFNLAFVAVIFCLPFFALAYELKNAEVTEENGIFQIRVTAIIDTPAEYIRQVLTDYTHIYRLSASIIESEVLALNPTSDTRIRTRLLACVSVFCREIERTDAVRTLASGDLLADIIPELSEFRSGQATWKITSTGITSTLIYEATLEPDFYIPPVFGVTVIGHSLKNEFISAFERIERIARTNAERDKTEEHSIASSAIDKTGLPCNKKLSATGLQ